MNIPTIEKKQDFLIKKTFDYFSFLRKKKVDLSSSAFCYIVTYSPLPGFGIILIWLKEKFSKIYFIHYVLKSIVLISTLSNYKIFKPKKQIIFDKIISLISI